MNLKKKSIFQKKPNQQDQSHRQLGVQGTAKGRKINKMLNQKTNKLKLYSLKFICSL